MDVALQHQNEVITGNRFEFGKNWSAFISVLDDERIINAENSLRTMLDAVDLDGKTFLDIGSGSGLFSLAARRLGAKVHSFDFDTDSYRCTDSLRNRFFSNDMSWQVEQGSALDNAYLDGLGKFDIVYSWGVLHHTGNMWQALENVSRSVAAGGQLFIAIYNDTGSQTQRWRFIKRFYCSLPGFLKAPFAAAAIFPDELKRFLSSLLNGDVRTYIHSWTRYKGARGMSRWHDIVDWVGGYPYEVATPDEIFDFFKDRGFILTKLKTGGVGLGCNEFVFKKG